MEINNFREAFERGDDPTADMTDASDINSVAGVLKLYLRSSLFLLPCPLLCCFLCDVNQVGHLKSILTNPPSTWKSY